MCVAFSRQVGVLERLSDSTSSPPLGRDLAWGLQHLTEAASPQQYLAVDPSVRRMDQTFPGWRRVHAGRSILIMLTQPRSACFLSGCQMPRLLLRDPILPASAIPRLSGYLALKGHNSPSPHYVHEVRNVTTRKPCSIGSPLLAFPPMPVPTHSCRRLFRSALPKTSSLPMHRSHLATCMSCGWILRGRVSSLAPSPRPPFDVNLRTGGGPSSSEIHTSDSMLSAHIHLPVRWDGRDLHEGLTPHTHTPWRTCGSHRVATHIDRTCSNIG